MQVTNPNSNSTRTRNEFPPFRLCSELTRCKLYPEILAGSRRHIWLSLQVYHLDVHCPLKGRGVICHAAARHPVMLHVHFKNARTAKGRMKQRRTVAFERRRHNAVQQKFPKPQVFKVQSSS